MLALLLLVAAASATPVAKLLPLFEDPDILHPLVNSDLRSWCADDCHHHVLDKPVFVVARSGEGSYNVHMAHSGLNGLSKSPLTSPVLDYLTVTPKIAIVAPFAKFPFEFFPGLLDTDFVIPEKTYKFRDFKEPPILAAFSEEEFKNFNDKKGYTKVADLSVDEKGVSVAKDYAHFSRSLPVPISPLDSSAGYLYLVPSIGQSPIIPSIPLTGSEILRFLPDTDVTSPDILRNLPGSSPIIDPEFLRSATPVRI